MFRSALLLDLAFLLSWWCNNLFALFFQGRLVERDFDIRRTANDSTVRAVVKEYKVNVSENYIEIHLFWAGKGTCCIPIQGAYGPLISAVSAKPGNKTQLASYYFVPSDTSKYLSVTYMVVQILYQLWLTSHHQREITGLVPLWVSLLAWDF